MAVTGMRNIASASAPHRALKPVRTDKPPASSKRMAMTRKNGTATMPFDAIYWAVPLQLAILPRPLRTKIKLSRTRPATVIEDWIFGFIVNSISSRVFQHAPSVGHTRVPVRRKIRCSCALHLTPPPWAAPRGPPIGPQRPRQHHLAYVFRRNQANKPPESVDDRQCQTAALLHFAKHLIERIVGRHRRQIAPHELHYRRARSVPLERGDHVIARQHAQHAPGVVHHGKFML